VEGRERAGAYRTGKLDRYLRAAPDHENVVIALASFVGIIAVSHAITYFLSR
jgi:hypothetical protein